MIKFYNMCTDLVDFTDMAPLPPCDQRHLWLRYQVEGYTKEIMHDFEQRLETIFGRQVNRVHTLDFEGLTRDMRQDFAERLRIVYTGDDGQELILALGLHIAEEMTEDGFGVYWLGSERVIPDKGDLSDYWVEISSGRDFLRGVPYMDRGAVNIPYLLAQYLFRYAKGRKIDARLSRGHFIGRLAHHFCLVSDDGQRGLSIAWVAPRLKRQPNVAAGAPGAAEDVPAVDEGSQADLTPVQAPQPPPPPPAAGRTMP
ncbi:hypothetical protein Tco_1279532 [Tanacetum coccineum]